MSIALGLLAAVGWGVADFLVALAARRVGTLQAMFWIQIAGLLAILVVLLVRFGIPTASTNTWLLALGLGVVNTFATALLYYCYTIGKLSIVTPIASGFAVVTALLALLAGERPAPLALGGAALLVAGVIVVARAPDQQLTGEKASRRRIPVGVREALGVALGFGFYFWGLGYVQPTLGPIWPIVVSRMVSALAVGLWMLRGRIVPIRLNRSLLPLVLGAAMMDTIAFLAFTNGIAGESTAIVTALAAIFSAVTVLLAWAIWRERLVAYQWAGVGVILAGVLLVSV